MCEDSVKKLFTEEILSKIEETSVDIETIIESVGVFPFDFRKKKTKSMPYNPTFVGTDTGNTFSLENDLPNEYWDNSIVKEDKVCCTNRCFDKLSEETYVVETDGTTETSLFQILEECKRVMFSMSHHSQVPNYAIRYTLYSIRKRLNCCEL